jgi:hypothetical protein
VASVSASPNPATLGESVFITWNTSTPAKFIKFDWPCGAVKQSVSGLSGSFVVAPPCAGSTLITVSGKGHPYDPQNTLASTTLVITGSPPAPPPEEPGNPSGVAMPTANLTNFNVLFSDDFNVPVPLGSFPSAVSSRWAAYAYPGTTLGGYYYPEKVVSIHDGVMDLWLHNEGGQWLFAEAHGRINGPAPASTGQLYGRYAIRFRADALPGYYAVPLLWPTSEVWPRDGEIDFPEGNLTGNIYGFVHHQGATVGSDQTAFNTGVKLAPGWHTAITEWKPASVKLYLDGALIGTVTSRVPNTPMSWRLQFTTSPAGLPPAGTSGHVLIDWIVVWKYAA